MEKKDVGAGLSGNREPHLRLGPGGTKRRQSSWAVVAGAIVVLTTVGSVLAAGAVAHSGQQKAHASFETSSAEVASSLKLAIQHEQDLVVDVGGFITSDVSVTQSQFLAWAGSVRALQRYPELIGFGELVIVPASGLAAFARHSVADPIGPLGPGGTFQVVPPGKRAFYCFVRVEDARDPGQGAPAGYDYCTGAQGVAALAVRDSGQATDLPVKVGNVTSLAVETPVYSGGAVPLTVAARRAEFVGWIGMSLVPKVVLAPALEDHPGYAVSLRYLDGASQVVFKDGTARVGAGHATVNLHNGWTVETFAAYPPAACSTARAPSVSSWPAPPVACSSACWSLSSGPDGSGHGCWSAKRPTNFAIRRCTTRLQGSRTGP
jgi:hypothetical protein